jgi:hypothetical protein
MKLEEVLAFYVPVGLLRLAVEVESIGEVGTTDIGGGVAVTGWVMGLWGSDRLRPKVVVMDEFWRLLTDRATAACA